MNKTMTEANDAGRDAIEAAIIGVLILFLVIFICDSSAELALNDTIAVQKYPKRGTKIKNDKPHGKPTVQNLLEVIEIKGMTTMQQITKVDTTAASVVGINLEKFSCHMVIKTIAKIV